MKNNKTALLILDMQNEMIHEKGKLAGMGIYEHCKKQNAIENTKKLLEKARSNNIKVIFVKVEYSEDYPETQNSKSPMQQMVPQTRAMIKKTWGTEFHEELKPMEDEIVISKSRISPFTNPEFEKQIKGFDKLILTGVATSWVVEDVARIASDKDYKIIVAEDCCASMNQEMHDFSIKNILPNIAQVNNSNEILKIMELENGN